MIKRREVDFPPPLVILSVAKDLKILRYSGDAAFAQNGEKNTRYMPRAFFTSA